jgi:hypothetical protein
MVLNIKLHNIGQLASSPEFICSWWWVDGGLCHKLIEFSKDQQSQETSL